MQVDDKDYTQLLIDRSVSAAKEAMRGEVKEMFTDAERRIGQGINALLVPMSDKLTEIKFELNQQNDRINKIDERLTVVETTQLVNKKFIAAMVAAATFIIGIVQWGIALWMK